MAEKPVRALPERPSLEYLKKLAKERLRELSAVDPEAALARAQLEVAREYGFRSWRALRAHVTAPGAATVGRTVEEAVVQAALRGDAAGLAALLGAQPGLIGLSGGAEGDPKPLLHLAAMSGSAEAVGELLACGAPVDARCAGDRATALHFAAEAGALAAVQRLVEAGADVCAGGAEHAGTPLGWATAMGSVHRDVADYLIARGAEAEFFPCVALGRVADVGAALDAEPARIRGAQGPIEHGRLPLHVAVLGGSLAMVALLLERGADPNGRDAEGETPLSYAARPGVERAVAATLEQAGARLDLLAAVRLGEASAAEAMLREEPLRLHPGGSDERALLLAAAQRDAPAVRWLLANGAPPDAKHVYWTICCAPLHQAAGAGYADIVEILLGAGADPQVRDDSFNSHAAGWARHFGHSALARAIEDWPEIPFSPPSD